MSGPSPLRSGVLSAGDWLDARVGASWPLWLLLSLASFLILWKLGSYSLVNGDEEIYHVVARTMLETGDYFRLQFYLEQVVGDFNAVKTGVDDRLQIRLRFAVKHGMLQKHAPYERRHVVGPIAVQLGRKYLG